MQRPWGGNELVMSKVRKEGQGGWNTVSPAECGRRGREVRRGQSRGCVRATGWGLGSFQVPNEPLAFKQG